jgi:uncharacterized protein (DUF58 family)
MSFRKNRHRRTTQSRIYIIPSGRGLVFLGTDIILVLAAATYNNNLIFILAFFLAGVFFIAMVQTQFNLQGVQLRYLSAEEGFAGEGLNLLFQMTQKHPRVRRALMIRSLSRKWKTLSGTREDLNGEETLRPVRATMLAWRRGVHELPEIALESYYPLGLFRTWVVIHPEGQLIVYPKPKGDRHLEPLNSISGGQEEMGLGASPDGDFGELKPYKVGESYHQIAWKHYARTNQLLSKVHWGDVYKHYHLSLRAEDAKKESELSQLSAWIQQAAVEHATFAMDLPQESIQTGTGMDHAHLCWRALAYVGARK